MTTPIHTIVWLELGNALAAAAELNRSMHAAAYGPFNVRNEVDAHADVVGGHFNNTHFLTGDGGFLQVGRRGRGSEARSLAWVFPSPIPASPRPYSRLQPPAFLFACALAAAWAHLPALDTLSHLPKHLSRSRRVTATRGRNHRRVCPSW